MEPLKSLEEVKELLLHRGEVIYNAWGVDSVGERISAIIFRRDWKNKKLKQSCEIHCSKSRTSFLVNLEKVRLVKDEREDFDKDETEAQKTLRKALNIVADRIEHINYLADQKDYSMGVNKSHELFNEVVALKQALDKCDREKTEQLDRENEK